MKLKRTAAILVPLFAIQFFSWSGLFALWIYAVPVVTRFMFAATASDSTAYRSGLFWVSAGFAFYSLLGTSLAFLLPRVVAGFGYGTTHGGALFIGALGIASLSVIERPMLLIPAFLAIGIAWSSIGNIPYAIVSRAAAAEHIDRTMRLFGFSTAIPQAFSTFALTFAVDYCFGTATNRVMALGGASMAIAGLIAIAFKRRFD